MWLYFLSSVLLVFILFSVYYYKTRITLSPNPFATDVRRPPEPMVTDRTVRNKVLKQASGFTIGKVPENLDAIVIGSGIGGSLAALLAKAGKKVLMLEQHDQAGGCCHTFIDKGFEFDTGLHYVGEMHEFSPLQIALDQITDGQLQWANMENNFDTLILGDKKTGCRYRFYSGKPKYVESLKSQFPYEKEATDKFFKLVKGPEIQIQWLAITIKMIPFSLVRFLIRTGLIYKCTDIFKLAGQSVAEVVNELTENKDLRAVLCYIFLSYGVGPRDASFALHALLVHHFIRGAYYPRGGASEIAFHIIPVIQRAGGKVLVRAPIKHIPVNKAGEAYGVIVRKGEEDISIFAPMVISDAGIFNTFEGFSLRKELQLLVTAIQHQLSMIQHGIGSFNVFVGLNGTSEELGLKAENFWIYPDNEIDSLMDKVVSFAQDELLQGVPMIFISFPSAKDPTWNDRYPGKSTMIIVSVACYEWFEEWKDEKVMHRGSRYDDLKMTITSKMIEQALELFPQLEGKV
uniref:Retinol saturase, tandem duplicate 2 n=1 Tax=Latimeria chalumnae TaxID=7897 RepID=H3AY50_LATCH